MDTVINNLIKLYIEKYKFPKELKINVLITNDLFKDCSEFLKKYNRDINGMRLDFNGATCFPSNISETTMIFISEKLVRDCNNNNFQFICTFFHELTHAIDYYNYCLEYCNGDYEAFLNDPSLYPFKTWSEFNAKSISYLLYCQFFNGELYCSEEYLNYIIESELPFQNNYLVEEIKKYDINEAIYLIIQYLGRYYVWETLFEEQFKKGIKFPKLLNEKANPELLDLYNALKTRKDEKKYYDELFKKINLLKGKLIKNGLY